MDESTFSLAVIIVDELRSGRSIASSAAAAPNREYGCESRETRSTGDHCWAGRRASFRDCREGALLERWQAQFWMTRPIIHRIIGNLWTEFWPDAQKRIRTSHHPTLPDLIGAIVPAHDEAPHVTLSYWNVSRVREWPIDTN